MTQPYNPYTELAKSVARIQQNLQEIRLQSVLKSLAVLKSKSRRMKNLEEELTKQLSRQLQSSAAIDELLTEIESLLVSNK